MASILEVKYFNSFILKKRALDRSVGSAATRPKTIWNGSFGIPENIGGYPVKGGSPTATETSRSWIIEEARIRGGYNLSLIHI